MGVVVDGCPPKIPLSEEDIQQDLERRKPGQSTITTARKEGDTAEILSGVFEGVTLGTPIAITLPNQDARGKDYREMREKYRPSHADYTYQEKFGIRNHEGGGRSSARETSARVAAGAIAKKVLMQACPEFRMAAYIERIQDIAMPGMESFPSVEEVDASPVRCPHPNTAGQMVERIKQVRDKGESVGGQIICRVQGLPLGWGAPVFDRLEADLAKAMLSIPATKGFEVGSGFAGTYLKGSEHNDRFIPKEGGGIGTETNRSGGVQGGISNGEELYFRVAFKPTATVLKKQDTVTSEGEATVLQGRGRHDPCVLPRAVPIVEAMSALVLVDHFLRHRAQNFQG